MKSDPKVLQHIKELLRKGGNLSAPYLQRKFKMSYAAAHDIIQEILSTPNIQT